MMAWTRAQVEQSAVVPAQIVVHDLMAYRNGTAPWIETLTAHVAKIQAQLLEAAGTLTIE